MSLPFVVTSGRSLADRLMPDTGTIMREATGGTLNPATGVWTPEASTTIYSGPMRVRPVSSSEIEELFGDEEVTKARYVGTLPASAPIPKPDDRLTVNAGSAEWPRTFRVVNAPSATWRTARRLALETVE